MDFSGLDWPHSHGTALVLDHSTLRPVATLDSIASTPTIDELRKPAGDFLRIRGGAHVASPFPAELCGHVLARAHARTGDAAMISGYMGDGGAFDTAIVAFATAYADQAERDHAALAAAVKSGKVTAETGR